VFTSRRRLTINNLIFILLGFKSSIQRELDRFYKALSDEDFNIRAVTKGALTQARANLNPEAFKRLNTVAANTLVLLRSLGNINLVLMPIAQDH
jgi:hypothetical protein